MIERYHAGASRANVIARSQELVAGVEPASRPYKGRVFAIVTRPARPGRCTNSRTGTRGGVRQDSNLQFTGRRPDRESNPALRLDKAVSWPMNDRGVVESLRLELRITRLSDERLDLLPNSQVPSLGLEPRTCGL